MLRARDYRGLDDLRSMQELTATAWRERENPPVSHHVGDLPWGRFSVTGREPEFPTRLWDEDGELVAWAWLTLPRGLEVMIASGRRSNLLDDVIAWADERAGCEVEVEALDADTELCELLTKRAFSAREEDGDLVSHAMTLERLPKPVVATGYTLRHVRLPDDLPRRTAVHRAAFGTPERPSRVTEESYARVTRSWPYRAELDWVVEASDGVFAAFCLAWLDEENRVGELEPVGTHIDHRRLGLARAVCTAALGALRDAGAETATVLATTENARALYRAIGFQEVGRYSRFRRS